MTHSEAYIKIMRKRKSSEIRAKRRRNRFLVKLFCAVLTVTLLAAVFGRTSSYADSKEMSYKYYTSITVMPGDTLTGIAEHFITDDYQSMDKYISEVMAINHMTSDSIKAGCNLIFPYYSSELK